MFDRRSFLKLLSSGATLALVPSAELLAKTPGKRYAMVFDVRRCTGCLSCTVNCSIENNVPEGRARTAVVQQTVQGKKGTAILSMPNQCNHCENPSCVKVCPVKATYKREEDGIVVIDYDRCIHCMACVSACPYHARKADPTHQVPPEKCNFCIHRVQEGLLPSCVESCIGGARVFGDLNDPTSEVYELVKSNKVYTLLNKYDTRPNIYYIGLPEVLNEEEILTTNPALNQR